MWNTVKGLNNEDYKRDKGVWTGYSKGDPVWQRDTVLLIISRCSGEKCEKHFPDLNILFDHIKKGIKFNFVL